MVILAQTLHQILHNPTQTYQHDKTYPFNALHPSCDLVLSRLTTGRRRIIITNTVRRYRIEAHIHSSKDKIRIYKLRAVYSDRMALAWLYYFGNIPK